MTLADGNKMVGWIGYGQWEKNPSQIEFFTDSTSASGKIYQTEQLISIEIKGGDLYETATVALDRSPLKPTVYEQVSNVQPVTILLRVLVKGTPVTLYEYVDEKKHYFIKNGDTPVTELTYNVRRSNNGNYLVNKAYIQQLKNLMLGNVPSPELLRSIEGSRYNAKYLQPVVVDINKIKGSSTYVSTPPKNAIVTRFVGAGLSFTTLQPSGTLPPPVSGFSGVSSMSFNTAIAPFVTAGFDIMSQRNRQKTGFRLELFFSKISYTGKNEFEQKPPQLAETHTSTYTLDQTNLGVGISFMYNFVRKPSYKIYFSPGLSFALASYGTNHYQAEGSISGVQSSKENYLSLSSVWTPVHARVGVLVKSHWDVALHSNVFGNFTASAGFGLNVINYGLQVRYRF